MKQNNWRLLADLNISLKTVDFLQSLGFDAKRIGINSSSDEEVVRIAKEENRAIITFDKDFGEIYYFHKEKSFTAIVLYAKNQTSESVNKILKKFLEETSPESIENKLVILYEGRYRIIS